jgi:hypothetical protein
LIKISLYGGYVYQIQRGLVFLGVIFVQYYLNLALRDSYGTKYETIGWIRSTVSGETNLVKYDRVWINVYT